MLQPFAPVVSLFKIKIWRSAMGEKRLGFEYAPYSSVNIYTWKSHFKLPTKIAKEMYVIICSLSHLRFNYYLTRKQSRWFNGYHAPLECDRSPDGWSQAKDYRMSIRLFSTVVQRYKTTYYAIKLTFKVWYKTDIF